MDDRRPPESKLECEILPSDVPSPRERVEWTSFPELPGVRVIHVRHSRMLLKMFHTTFSIAALLRVRAEWMQRGTRHRSRSGQVLVWEPGDFHRCLRHFGPDEVKGGDATTSQSGMVIEPAVMQDLARECGVAPEGLHLAVRNGIDPEVFRNQRAFYASLKSPATSLERQSRFAESLFLLLERFFERRARGPGCGTEKDAVERVRGCIEDRFSEEIRLEDLARIAGLTRFHLIRRFKERIGIPPHQYQIEVRISRGRQLLNRGASPAAAAAAVGFADQSHFARHFKRVWKITPGEYARLR
jgi:AraC-like DNA-binding protein